MSFFDEKGDARMEHQNRAAWYAITQYVIDAQAELPRRTWDVLDWGCHSGGLLEHMTDEFGSRIRKATGVDPDHDAMAEARTRLKDLQEKDFCPNLINVPDKSIDVFVSHEVLYLVKLQWFLKELKRVLRPEGAAFVALGSHGENVAWMRWHETLASKYGHVSYVHYPLDILEQGNTAGFHMEFQRLWRAGYPEMLRYSPPEDKWGEFLTIEEALAFRDAKLIFQFWPKS